MRVFGWSAGNNGCQFYRLALPLAALAEIGWETSFSERLPTPVQFGADADVLIGQRVCNEGSSKTWQRFAREGRMKLVFEVDDDLLTVDPSNREAFGTFAEPDRRRRLIENIAVADVVTTSTDVLADRLSQINPNVHVVPNAVPDWLLEWERPVNDLLTIGWGGGASHARDFAECASYLRRFLGRNPEVEFHNVGQDYRQGWPQARFSRWFEDTNAWLRHIDFDIGLAPLVPSVFNQAKSPIKALEYAALGIPAIASEVGPYPGFVEDGVTGLLVRRPHEWAAALKALADDPEERARLGTNAREKAAQHTMRATVGLWAEAMGSQVGIVVGSSTEGA